MSNEKTQHTPGRWWLDDEDSRDTLVIIGRRENCSRGSEQDVWEVARIENSCFWDDPKTEELDRANARLIASAPDLYETLETMLEGMHSRHAGPVGACDDHYCFAARESLARARGESP
jgi:hypothetical protein